MKSFKSKHTLFATSMGSLHIITSMMYGGKTTYLMRIIETMGRALKILYINHKIDTRSDMPYSTHSLTLDNNLQDKLNVTMIMADTLTEIPDDTLSKYPIVCIDEAQFFSDLKDGVNHMVDDLKCEVYVAGLNGDYKRNKFGQIAELVPHADTFTLLRDTLCSFCSAKGIRKTAIFTHRIKDVSGEQIEIGSCNYTPLCRNCFNENNK